MPLKRCLFLSKFKGKKTPTTFYIGPFLPVKFLPTFFNSRKCNCPLKSTILHYCVYHNLNLSFSFHFVYAWSPSLLQEHA